MAEIFEPPFRWNVTNQTYLGSLLHGQKADVYPAFLAQLLPCCSRVVAFAGEADLMFVGRSPESIFDHLSGLLLNTSWFDRLALFQFSVRSYNESETRLLRRDAIMALRTYLASLQLSPSALARRPRPVAFIDLVAYGVTFSRLIKLLYRWTKELQYDWNAVNRKIRLVGITVQKKTSPKTWRWQQQADWVHLLQRGSIKNVSIPSEMWTYLGETQPKVTKSYTLSRWGMPEAAKPEYSEERLQALRLAYHLFELGRTNERRATFASLLAEEPAMSERWFRALLQEVRTE